MRRWGGAATTSGAGAGGDRSCERACTRKTLGSGDWQGRLGVGATGEEGRGDGDWREKWVGGVKNGRKEGGE